VNRRHIKITYLLTAPEPAWGVQCTYVHLYRTASAAGWLNTPTVTRHRLASQPISITSQAATPTTDNRSITDSSALTSIDKRKVMHFDFNNKEVDYILGNQRLGAAVEEDRALGVIDKSLKSSRQCAKAAPSANAVLGMIRRT